MSEFTIRALRKDEVAAYRELRLRALKTNPEAFGRAYEESIHLPLEAFAARIPEENSDSVIFVAAKGEKLFGMMGFVRVDRLKQLHTSFIWGVYITPEARGNGLGRKLIEQVMAHAKQVEGLRQVQLSVVTSNTVALQLYQSAGFEIWGTEPQVLKVGDTFYDEHHMIYFID